MGNRAMSQKEKSPKVRTFATLQKFSSEQSEARDEGPRLIPHQGMPALPRELKTGHYLALADQMLGIAPLERHPPLLKRKK